jgi:hypothetical protein
MCSPPDDQLLLSAAKVRDKVPDQELAAKSEAFETLAS